MPGTSRSRLWAFICSLVQCFPCQSGCCREYREMRDRQGVTLSDATPPNRSDYPTHELFLRAMREWSTRELDQFNLATGGVPGDTLDNANVSTSTGTSRKPKRFCWSQCCEGVGCFSCFPCCGGSGCGICCRKKDRNAGQTRTGESTTDTHATSSGRSPESGDATVRHSGPADNELKTARSDSAIDAPGGPTLGTLETPPEAGTHTKVSSKEGPPATPPSKFAAFTGNVRDTGLPDPSAPPAPMENPSPLYSPAGFI